MTRASGLLALLLTTSGCVTVPPAQPPAAAIVGVWLVRIPEAPFPLHMFAFHSDGTVEQSNPDAA